MPSLKKRIVSPIFGYDYSLPSSEVSAQANFGQNIRDAEGVVIPRHGHATYGTGALSGAVLHIGRFQRDDLNLLATRFSFAKSEVYNPGTGAWDDITKSATNWTGTEGTDYHDSTVFNDKLLITNGVDNIQQYTGSGLCTDLSGTPPKAKFIETVGDYVVIGHILDSGVTYPYRLQWCDTGDETDWTNGNAGFFDLASDFSPLVGLKKLNELLIAYKENSIYVGRLVESVVVFDFQPQVTGIGLLNNRCVVEYNGLHYFLAQDGQIYVFNGIKAEPVSQRIENQIYSIWNKDRLAVNFARNNTHEKMIQFYIAEGSSDWPNVVWNIDYEDGTITKDTVNNLTCASTFKDTSGQLTFGDLAIPFGSATFKFGDGVGGSGFEFPILGSSSGIVVKETIDQLNDSSSAIEQISETKDFHFDYPQNYKRWLSIEFIAKGVSLALQYSTDSGVNWTQINKDPNTNKFTLTSFFANYVGWFDVYSQKIRFRFINLNADEWFSLQEFTIKAIVKESILR